MKRFVLLLPEDFSPLFAGVTWWKRLAEITEERGSPLEQENAYFRVSTCMPSHRKRKHVAEMPLFLPQVLARPLLLSRSAERKAFGVYPEVQYTPLLAELPLKRQHGSNSQCQGDALFVSALRSTRSSEMFTGKNF
ncbi:hypothetical protein INR49_022444 [Caranx melampygus]|nr:hypothetical protein INR49_022444 [Caranx melampygus]